MDFESAYYGFVFLLEEFGDYDRYALSNEVAGYWSFIVEELGADEVDVEQAFQDACDDFGWDAAEVFGAEP